jgi:pseudouridine-5'-phosphate glycosidase
VRMKDDFVISAEVRKAIKNHKPVVALESAIISFGLPFPHNLRTALECERIVRHEGALPATIGIIDGCMTVGLREGEIRALATRTDVVKANLSNLAALSAAGFCGATSVSATLALAVRAGIEVLATGGIGGVHRDFADMHDVSADLTALARYRAIVVCSGAKAILDTRATVEELETFGIPILGFRTDRVPLFYTRRSSFSVDLRADKEKDIAAIYRAHKRIPSSGALIAAVPIPKRYEIPARIIEQAMQKAARTARRLRVSGRDLTPHLLKSLEGETHGASLRANLALIRNNVRIAARIAKALAG